jgi:hypothetical protein
MYCCKDASADVNGDVVGDRLLMGLAHCGFSVAASAPCPRANEVLGKVSAAAPLASRATIGATAIPTASLTAPAVPLARSLAVRALSHHSRHASRSDASAAMNGEFGGDLASGVRERGGGRDFFHVASAHKFFFAVTILEARRRVSVDPLTSPFSRSKSPRASQPAASRRSLSPSGAGLIACSSMSFTLACRVPTSWRRRVKDSLILPNNSRRGLLSPQTSTNFAPDKKKLR